MNCLICRLAPLALALALPFATGLARAEFAAAAGSQREALAIVTTRGPVHFKVEVARTAKQQEHGLMFRTRLAPDAGMIFPFKPPQPVSFWMKNTKIPLDMIFIRADGTISGIAFMTTPDSLELISSNEAVAAVLEIAGGRAKALGVAPGDHVSWGPPSR